MTVQNIGYDKLDIHVKNIQYIGKNKVDRCRDQYKNPSYKKKIMYIESLQEINLFDQHSIF